MYKEIIMSKEDYDHLASYFEVFTTSGEYSWSESQELLFFFGIIGDRKSYVFFSS